MKHLWHQMTRFGRDEAGSVLVEFAVVLSLFLLLLFGFIDFGRMAFSYVAATKATELAVREAVVNGPVCAGLPATNQRGTLNGTATLYQFGTSCNVAAGICRVPTTVTCNGTSQNPTSAAIWAQVRDLMPHNATVQNLRFTYAFDANTGFLGGPYSPTVTVEITDLDFQFISPLGSLARLAGAKGLPDLGKTLGFPGMSTSLPAESLTCAPDAGPNCIEGADT
ncbi:MAG: TadE/TadG family type IV pilus assembly protein [Paracoccaceae bacterium]